MNATLRVELNRLIARIEELEERMDSVECEVDVLADDDPLDVDEDDVWEEGGEG